MNAPTPALAAPNYKAPATLPADRTLTPEQIRFFHEQGYLAVDSVMPVSEIPTVRAIYDRIFSEAEKGANPGFHDLGGTSDSSKKAAIPQILEPAKYAPELLETQLVANLKAMMKQLLGPEGKMASDHAINKPAHGNTPTPWHQDEAYWDPAKEYHSLSVWVPLQPATKINGCMHFIPGSQNWEVLAHQPIGNNPKSLGLEIVPGTFDETKAVACELPAGGATFHADRTLHYTPGNQSDDFRRAYIAIGEAPNKARATPRTFPWLDVQAAARKQA